jgi:2-polyprenyl-6-hydroxyphenyl methylase/3-demethylubiquinone-9 3-methyltransferase
MLYACADCDFHFIDRLDVSEERDRPLTDSARSYIAMRENESAALHPARLELVCRFAGNASKVLDIGAGIGQFQLLAAERGLACRGIEPSRLRSRYALETFGLELSNQLVDSDYWQRNFHHHFDAVTLWDVIEHVNFPRETVAAALNLLRPGGVLLLDTPSRDVAPYRLSHWLGRLSGGRISLFLPGFYSAAPFGHKQIFRPGQMTGLLAELGLEIIHRAGGYGHPGKGNKIILAALKKT